MGDFPLVAVAIEVIEQQRAMNNIIDDIGWFE